jgi:hypothetical protein
MLAIVLALAALASTASQPSLPGAEAQPLRAEDLKWRSIPKGTDFARFFPERASRFDIEGAATVLCQISSNRRLTNCASQSETPEGYGFGHAATRLGALFELAGDQRDMRAKGAHTCF